MTPISDTLHVSPLGRLIIDRGFAINTDRMAPRGFSYKDFSEYEHGSFRNVVSSLKEKGVGTSTVLVLRRIMR